MRKCGEASVQELSVSSLDTTKLLDTTMKLDAVMFRAIGPDRWALLDTIIANESLGHSSLVIGHWSLILSHDARAIERSEETDFVAL